MSISSRLIGRLMRLPPALTYAVSVERDIPIPMPDGVCLLADRYFPRQDSTPPLILIRSPYGRWQMGPLGRLFAERGYQVIIQSVRGTFGSGGDFKPLRQEKKDGLATLAWLAAQPWFGGSVGLYGPSYLGLVQWAVAADAPAYLKALVPQITTSNFRPLVYPGESFALDLALSWTYIVHHQERPFWQMLWALSYRQRRTLAPAFACVPLVEADRLVVGRRVNYYQGWLEHTQPDDPFWAEIDYSRRLEAVSAPVHLIAGWYDIFLPDQLTDFKTLKQAGRTPYLTIGPWAHIDFGAQSVGLQEALAWFDAHLRGDSSRLRQLPVRLFIMGAKRWLDLPDWPPPATPTRWYLHPGGSLAPMLPAESPPDRYDYNPTDPTPAVGGIVLGRHAGPRDNRKLEARPDVLTYTSPPLERDLELIGPVAAELYLRSSLEHTDFFARLCDVEPGGRSINVCDGLIRLWPGRIPQDPAGVHCIHLDLWPTAYCFRQGHRLRLQVSSGAHPRFSRNLGGGEPLGAAVTFKIAHQELYHDPTYPSAVILPVYCS